MARQAGAHGPLRAGRDRVRRDLPEWGWGATQGEAEALSRAEYALAEMVAAALEDGDELPTPAAGDLAPDERWVAVGAHLAAKAALH